MDQSIQIKIYVITFRRVLLLERALKSLIAQSYSNWIAEVLNDDPADHAVAELITNLNDPRIQLSSPAIKRGGTQNFNYAFLDQKNPYATILEDDNWFEPTYLEVMLKALIDKPSYQVAVGNQNIWIENKDQTWTNTHRTVWPSLTGYDVYSFNLIDKCGSAKICNSSLFWNTKYAKNWLTPNDIPIDVTEHYRERVLPHPILLINNPLSNYSQTLISNRKTNYTWGIYQTILIASVFATLNDYEAHDLAKKLWNIARNNNRPLSTSLLHCGLYDQKSRILVKMASPQELIRYLFTWIKNPIQCYKIISSKPIYHQHLAFLTSNLIKESNILNN